LYSSARPRNLRETAMRTIRGALAALCVTLAAAPAFADTLVLASSNSTTDYPFDLVVKENSPSTAYEELYQQVYTTAVFAGIQGPIEISAIAFTPHSSFVTTHETIAASLGVTNADNYFTNTLATFGFPNPSLDRNFVGGRTQVMGPTDETLTSTAPLVL